MSITRLTHLLSAVAIVALFTAFGAGAQTSASGEPHNTGPDDISVESHDQVFNLNASKVNPTRELSAFADTLRRVGDDASVTGVTIVGSASPDGPVKTNDNLARKRAEALLSYFLTVAPSVADSLYSVSSVGEDWNGLVEMIPAYLDPGQIAKIESLINSTPNFDERERKLRLLDGGRVWNRLKQTVFPRLRRASVTVALRSGNSISYTIDSVGNSSAVVPEPEPEPEPVPEPEPEPEPIPEPEPEPMPVVVEAEEEGPHWYLKTNVPAWALLWINLAGEVDCAEHLSVSIPVYYSGFNYFTSTRKYRTFAVQPEVRYWFRPDNQGFFLNAHVGLAWYNVAFTGAYRYQDHNRNTPAYGGGIGVGFRFNISRNKLWRLEASIGAGVYPLKYDLFENRPNGLLVSTKSRTFFGIDNAALSICYTFDMKKRKKGGDR